MRQTFLRLFLVFILSFSIFAQTIPDTKNLMGFSAENSARQKALEAKFDSYLKAENLAGMDEKTFGASASRRFTLW